MAVAKPKMEATVAHFIDELKTIRTGRASAQILDSVVVSYYGVQTPLRQLATISVPDATQLLIQPFDASSINAIREGIEQAELGLNPSDDGRVLRLNIPPLNTERREELIKKVWLGTHVSANTVDSHMSRLRKKIDQSFECRLETQYGCGWTLSMRLDTL